MEQEPTYIKGFNDGYKLAKFQPELYAKLSDSLSQDNEYERGILEGAKEFEKEREHTRVGELDQVRKAKELSKDLEQEK